MTQELSKPLEVTKGKELVLSAPPPVLYALASALKPFETTKNKYQTYRDFTSMDPELESALTRVALMASYAYKGVFIHAGQQYTENETEILRLLKKFDQDYDIRDLIFSITYHLMRDGDDIYIGQFSDGIGLLQLQPLPIEITTAVMSTEQINQAASTFDTYLTSPSLYVINEGTKNQQVFPENPSQKVFHFGLSKRAEMVTDILGRKTFGVWSKSLLESVESRILWKQAILIADILWRYRNVPREEHVLDLAAFDPAFFPGETQEARIAAAKAAAETSIKAYADSISKRNVDQGYIHGKDVEIKYVEPQKTTFVSPNEVVDQINQSIYATTSVPEAAIIGRGRSTFATELVVASYTILLPEFLVYKVKTKLLEILREHLRRINILRQVKFTEEEISAIDIKTSLILQIFQGELIRQTALLAATGSFTLDELRERVGLDPLTDEQIKRLVVIVQKGGGRNGQYAQTVLDIARGEGQQTEPQNPPITDHSKGDKQKTLEDDKYPSEDIEQIKSLLLELSNKLPGNEALVTEIRKIAEAPKPPTIITVTSPLPIPVKQEPTTTKTETKKTLIDEEGKKITEETSEVSETRPTT
jgi:hypothetical protein